MCVLFLPFRVSRSGLLVAPEINSLIKNYCEVVLSVNSVLKPVLQSSYTLIKLTLINITKCYILTFSPSDLPEVRRRHTFPLFPKGLMLNHCQ